MTKLWAPLLLLLMVSEIKAQRKINAAEIFQEGYENLLSNEYHEAQFSFQLLLQNGYGNANISYLSGLCFLNIPGQEQKAISNLEEAIKNTSEIYTEGSFEQTSAPLQSYYYLAQSYRIAGNYLNARRMLLALQDLIDTLKDKNTNSLIKHELSYEQNAAVLKKFPVAIEIYNAGNSINSSLDETSPAVTPDESTIFFLQKKKFYDAIIQSKKAGDKWSANEEITNHLGSDGEFRVLAISADGLKMLLYSYDMYSSGDIYESKFSGNKWSKCKKLNKNINSAYSENFASYSPDGNTIFFTSNRPGGFGGYDIYKSYLGSDGEWSVAKNLGPEINTEFDEATPYPSPDGNYLYFSSKGHFSMGGFDIFRSKINHELFLYPRNLGFPLNSSSDNLNWVPMGNGLSGYIPEILPNGMGGFDIWKIRISELPDIPRFVISGNAKIIGDSTNDAAEIKVYLTNIKNKTADSLCSTERGNMRFEFKKPSGSYQLEASANGYNTVKKVIFLDPEQLESELNFDLNLEKPAERVKPRTIELRSIFFSFDSRTLNSGYYAMLDSIAILLLDFPALHLEITGHTDGKGSKAYNNTLSIQRSESVKNYLSSKNIDTARLKCLGEGSLKPIALEKTRHGKDLPSGRLWNRRVELRFSSNVQILIKTVVPYVPERLRMDKQPNLK